MSFAKIENPQDNSKHIIKNIMLFPKGYRTVVGRIRTGGEGTVYPILR